MIFKISSFVMILEGSCSKTEQKKRYTVFSTMIEQNSATYSIKYECSVVGKYWPGYFFYMQKDNVEKGR